VPESPESPFSPAVTALQRARATLQPGPAPRTFGVATLTDAYRVQELTRTSSSSPTHYKIGATSTGLRQHLGAEEPVFGVLTSPPLAAGSILPRSRFIAPLLEVEVAVVMAGAPADPGDPRSVREAADHVRVAFEVADCATEGWAIELVDLVADNGCAATAVLGELEVTPDELDELTLDAVLEHDGTEIARGGLEAVVGGPWGTLAWLARTLPAHGLGLEAGSVVLSGSFTTPAPMAQAGVYTARIDGLGAVTLRAT
jgi:2-keto-4-pentenoate hydratase